MGRLAFLISAHTDAAQLARLVGSLPDESDFFVHIDRKSDISQFHCLTVDSRVHFIKHRVDVVWGSINEVEYQMEMVRAALSVGTDFDFLITLSGMDYPIWSKQRISDFFEQSCGKEILCGNDLSWQDAPARIYREYRLLASRPWRNGSIKNKFRVAVRKILSAIGVRKPLEFSIGGKSYHLYKGAAWWAISSQLARYVLSEWDNNVELVRYFSTGFCPAETFVQTVAFNSEWKEKCIEEKSRYVSLASLTPLTYIYYHPVVKILTEEDFTSIIESNKMFARKFVSGQSDKLVALLEADKSKEK